MTTISYVPRSLALGAAAGGNSYNLTMKNHSTSPWVFYVYQQLPNVQTSNVFSLAWFASPFMVVPDADITFQWSINYSFVWGAVGTLKPGITFRAGAQVAADLVSANTTTFGVSPGPNLSPPAPGNPQGSLVINNTAGVPNSTYSVGIGMGNAGTFVTAAGPNLISTFTPTPTYWIAAGTNVQVGTVLDITTVTQTAQVLFPVNVYDVTYTLSASNTWSSS